MRLPAAGWSWGIALCVVLALAWMRGASPPPVERVAGELPHSAFIWQRSWTAPVASAVEDAPELIQSLIPLAAEIHWEGGSPQVARIHPDWDVLAQRSPSIGLAIRVLVPPVPLTPQHPAVARLIETMLEGRQEAEQQGLEVTEIHLDLDCPTSRLREYAAWLPTVREALGDTALSITTLPTWLDSRDFPALIAACDDYVLQVHSLEMPTNRRSIAPLCDAERTSLWIEQAARLGRPFRLALPTYSYQLAFDDAGQFIGLVAEQDPIAPQSATSWVTLESNASELATLVETLAEDRPALLTGICWFRLPVATDDGNWPMITFEQVMRGIVPAPLLACDTETSRSGLIDLSIRNSGTASTDQAIKVECRWEGDAEPFVEALPGIKVERSGSSVRFTLSAARHRLPPGARCGVGWLRFPTSTEVSADVVDS